MTDATTTNAQPARPLIEPRRRRRRLQLRIAPWRDPRYGQILAQALLITYGVSALGFRLSYEAALAAAAGALLAELAGRARRAESFDPLSPLITAGSLTLLFRAEALWAFALAGFLAVGSKFLFRMGGRHIFNPAALVLFALPLAATAEIGLGGVWVSPGQWGQLGLQAIAIAGLGALIVTRAARLDTTLAFMAAWAALTYAEALYYGWPMSIPALRLESGAWLIFAFFMISDPATTPPTRALRIAHGVLVAALGYWLQINWFTETGPIWALVFAAPLVGGMRLLAQRRRPLWPLTPRTPR